MSKRDNLKCIFQKVENLSKNCKTTFIENEFRLLQRHTRFNVKTNQGYRLYDTASQLYFCSNCNNLLDQERVFDDGLCPGCRFEINARLFLEQIPKELSQ